MSGVISQGGWSPSRMRTLFVPAAPATSLRGVSPVPPDLIWPDKAAGDALDYNLDLTNWLADVSGDRLSAAVIGTIAPTGSSGDLAVAWSAVSANQVITWLTDGVSGQAYAITFNITTTLGRVLTQIVQIAVE